MARPVLAFEQRKPHLFYAAAFLLMFELANMFDDVRDPVRSLWHAFTALSDSGHPKPRVSAQPGANRHRPSVVAGR